MGYPYFWKPPYQVGLLLIKRQSSFSGWLYTSVEVSFSLISMANKALVVNFHLFPCQSCSNFCSPPPKMNNLVSTHRSLAISVVSL